MRQTSTVAILAAAVLAIAAAGCNQGDGGTSISGEPRKQSAGPKELIPRARPPIADLPVPSGFDLDQRRSVDYALSGARIVVHIYTGWPDKFSVKRFYERQMPISRWVLTTSMFERGEIILDFEKETERCRITTTEEGLFRKTHIRASMWTSGPVQTPEQPQ
jgi:hypothetical protein